MIIRHMPAASGQVFLTFDDGPDAIGTPEVLRVLREQNISATFFLVAEKARAQQPLLKQILAQGHAIGNHSWDHRYRSYFRGPTQLGRWLEKAQDEFMRLGVPSLSGFRPPAGIIFPHLIEAAQAQGLPLVLWNERFHDAIFPWTLAKAKRSANRLTGGSIVLLHDRQSAKRIGPFCTTLNSYIDQLKARGFTFAKLPATADLLGRP